MLDDYRQRFVEFHTQLARTRYALRAGLTARDETAFFWREASDLFSAEALAELQAHLNAVPASQPTERATVRRLVAFAQWGQMTQAGHEIAAELSAWETSASIRWEEQTLTATQTWQRLAQQRTAEARRELGKRLDEQMARGNEWRVELLQRHSQTLAQLGFGGANTDIGADTETSIRTGAITAAWQAWRGVDYLALRPAAERWLTQTESSLLAALDALLRRELGLRTTEASVYDLPALRALPRFAAWYAGVNWAELYRDLFAGLGFQTVQQSNVRLELVARAQQAVPPFCAALVIPTEVVLVANANAQAGVMPLQHFLRAAGEAQCYAWTSGTQRVEFRRPGDAAVALAWGELLAQLLEDPAFLETRCGITSRHGNVAELQTALAVLRGFKLRQAAATLLDELELYAGARGNATHEAAARAYAETLSAQLGIAVPATHYLNATVKPFASADTLRAAAFAAQLREWLRTQFGLRWWETRKAGEILIDLWNTGHRYTLEELSALIGLGALDFAWLAQQAQTAAQPAETAVFAI